MKKIIAKEKLLAAVIDNLNKLTPKSWVLVSVYNGLAECSVLELNDMGEIECDSDDADLKLYQESKVAVAKSYSLDFDGNWLDVFVNRDGGGVITSDLKADRHDPEFSAAIDGLENLILAHACAGIDISSDQYKQGVQVALYKIANEF